MLGFQYVLKGQNEFNLYYNQGQEKYSKREYKAAIDDFSVAIKNKKWAKNDYSIANAYMARSLANMHVKNYNAAIADIETALKVKAEYSELYYARSRIHYESEKYDECIKWAEKGLELKPEFEELILMKVKARMMQKEYQAALKDLDSVLIKINSRNLMGWMLKGEIMRTQKNYPGGIDALTRAIEIDPQNFVSFYNRGICYAQSKNFDAAYKDIQRGMEIDSTERWIGYNNIAFFILFEQKDYKAAMELFDKALKMNPEFDYALNNRGYAKLQMNDLKGAREDITKALELNKENAYAYKTYAQLLIAEKKEKQACEKLHKALELGYEQKYDDEVNELIKTHCK